MPSKSSKKRLITADDLDRLRIASRPEISPDADLVAFVVRTHGEKNDVRTDLWMVDTDGGEPRALTFDGTDSRPSWAPDGSCLAFARRTKQGTQIALLPAEGGEARLLTSFPQGDIGEFKWTADSERLLVSYRPRAEEWTDAAIEARKDSGESDPPLVVDDPLYRYDGDGYFGAQRYGLHEVDAESGASRVVYDKNRSAHFSFDIAPDGRRVALITNRNRKAFVKEHTSEILVLDLNTRKLTAVEGVAPGAKTAIAWSPNGKQLAWAGTEDADDTRLTANMDLWVTTVGSGRVKNLTGASDRCLVAPTLADTAEVSFDATFRWAPRGDRLFVQLGWHGETQIHSVPAKGGELSTHTSGRKQHYLSSISHDGMQLALVVETATKPTEIALATFKGRKLAAEIESLTDLNGPLLATLSLSRPSAKWVRSTGGARIHTFTMLPPGASPKRKRATVLNVHGGPASQYGYAFFFEFQLLAAQGYAVVFSNPRGGKGYGEDHCSAIHGDWGNKDWDDVQAVAEDMSHQPFCDAKRMGIAGGSYGGYMTLWAIGHTDRFAAAVADRCVSNMVSMWGSSDIYVWPDTYFPGNAWGDSEQLWEMSPLKHLGNAKTPTLLVHSEGDLRCNVAESDQAHAALAVRGVPTRYVRYPRNTSHGMSRGGPPDMRKHRLGEYLRWWRQWLG